MILADTSVWVDHLRAGDKALAALLDAGMVLAHPFVIGELALGNLRPREIVLKSLTDLPHASVATDAEVLHQLFDITWCIEAAEPSVPGPPGPRIAWRFGEAFGKRFKRRLLGPHRRQHQPTVAVPA